MSTIQEEDTNPDVPEQLVDWKNPPTLTELKQDLMDAKPSHDDQVSKINNWLDNLNVTGKAQPKGENNSSKVQPKLIRKQAEWRYAALTEPFMSTEDVFNATPTTWEDKQAAEQNQLVLNHQFNHKMDKTAFIDEYIRTAVDEGTVIVRVGWEFHEEEVEEEVPIVEYRVNPEFAPMHEHLSKLKQESPSQYATDVPDELKQAHDMTVEQGAPIEPAITGREMKKVMKTVRNAPTANVCDYRNVIIDPTCHGDLNKASFIIYSFESSMAQLTKDGKYKNLKKVNVSNNTILAEPDHAMQNQASTGNFNFSDEPRKKIVVREYWGYWDIHGTGTVVPFVATWVGDTMIRLEEAPFPDKKLPFIKVQYLPVRRNIYGEPDGALLEDNQKIVGAVTRGMIDIMGKSANGETGIRKDYLDATNRRKFDKGQDYEFNPNVDPRTGVFMQVYPEIPQSAALMIQMQNQEAESLTGVQSFNQGISGRGLGDVAVGVRGALDAASKRELGILRRLSAGVVEIGRKFVSMNSEFLSPEEVVRISNEEFVTVRRDDLAGHFDLKLSISTAEEDDNKAKEMGFMLQTMGPNMDPSLSQIILSDIAKLKKMPDLAERIANYQPQPDPMAQKIQELEVAKLEAEIAEIQAKTMQLQATAQLAGAKVGTEGAKAKQLSSNADLQDLNFVEQESGVTQERDLQKQGAQARAQGELKVLDHQFKREEQRNDLVKEYILNKKQ